MRVDLTGQPLRYGIVNAQIGCIHTKEEGANTLVVLDPDTQEVIHVPLRDEQVESFYADWFGKHVVVATPQDARELVTNGNGKH
jgi:hypothetical protein